MIYREELRNLGWSDALLDAVEEVERALPGVEETSLEADDGLDFFAGWSPPPCTSIDLASTASKPWACSPATPTSPPAAGRPRRPEAIHEVPPARAWHDLHVVRCSSPRK